MKPNPIRPRSISTLLGEADSRSRPRVEPIVKSAVQFGLACCIAICAASVCEAEPLPPEGFWQKGIKSEPPKEGVDRIFLVNRGWVSGHITKIDDKNVNIEAGGQSQTFTRPEVSLIQLTDWLSPKRRLDTQELKIRVEIEGEAECATIAFTKGTIIARIDSAPKFTKGGDADDRAETDRTTIRFEKGDKDKSITTLTADLTLLVPAIDLLTCEVQCARANGFSGPLNIRFLNPVDGKELVSVKRPTKDLWSRVDVPLPRLKAGSVPTKVDCVPYFELVVPHVKSLPRPQPPSSPKETTAARVILFDESMSSGRVVGMDEETLRLQFGISNQPVLIPRWKIAMIELNDWETAYRNMKSGAQTDADLTPPLTVTFSGPSAESHLELRGADTIAKLVVPPHFVTGWDHDDFAIVESERTLGFYKIGLDRAFTQVEATIVLRVTSKQSVEIGVNNAYTNVWAGDLNVDFHQTLTGKPVGSSGPATQKNLTSEIKISRPKLFGQ